MEQDYSKVGVFNVDGQWATRIRYEVTHTAGRIDEVRLRFLNGRHEVAVATLDARAAREVLGESNFAVIKNAVERKGQEATDPVAGDLKGRQLEYRQVTLEDDRQNSIEERGLRREADIEAAPRSRAEPRPPESVGTVPACVRDRFVVVDNQYHFPDRTLAFTDQGGKLKAVTDNVEVVRSLVAIAEAREWQALRVRGSETFRRQVWREASRRGIEVEGYEPSAVQVAELRQWVERSARAKSNADVAPLGPASTIATGATTARSQPVEPRRPPEILFGRLIEAGAAAYRFKPTASMSYYVKVQTAQGERTLWGVDLERAIAESRTQPKVGDTIGIENQGSRPVTLKSLQHDADGKAIDTTITANRNKWLIERAGYFEERAERAAAFASGEVTKRELAQRYPDLSGALVGLWLGEQFAARTIERPEDREKVVILVKERLLEALERGETIDAPKLRKEVGQRFAAVGDDVDEAGKRTRSRGARLASRRAERSVQGEELTTTPRVLS